MKRVFLIAASVAAVAGCATVSQMQATGGSRADGIVKLSYEVGMFDKVAIDEATALDTARRRCATWGYSDAEAFGGITRQCNAMSGYGCTQWFVTKEYQCISASGSQAAYAAPSIGAAPQIARTPAAPTGVKLVPAHTASGYCIEAPPGYQGTGSASAPAITAGMPRC
jgi:hypothetical protein